MLVVLAEELDNDFWFTTDRRDFAVYRLHGWHQVTSTFSSRISRMNQSAPAFVVKRKGMDVQTRRNISCRPLALNRPSLGRCDPTRVIGLISGRDRNSSRRHSLQDVRLPSREARCSNVLFVFPRPSVISYRSHKRSSHGIQWSAAS